MAPPLAAMAPMKVRFPGGGVGATPDMRLRFFAKGYPIIPVPLDKRFAPLGSIVL